jgi:hypothetical protein
MTQEQLSLPGMPKVAAGDDDEFKLHFALALNGILSNIPFGVNVDPRALAQVARNIALVALEVQNETLDR